MTTTVPSTTTTMMTRTFPETTNNTVTLLPSWFVIQVTIIASLGGCLFGYDMGAISGALPQLTKSFDLIESQQEWVVSILYLGGGVGASMGGFICDRMGRQRTIVGTDVVFMLGAAWLYASPSYQSVLVGRFVVGIAVAVSGVADVSYLHEMAPLEWRGAVVSVNEACISLGFLLAYIAGYIYNDHQQEEWRLIFGWAGILASIQLIGMWNMPESPIWLEHQGRYEESRQAWRKIHSNDDTIHPQSSPPPPPQRRQQSRPRHSLQPIGNNNNENEGEIDVDGIPPLSTPMTLSSSYEQESHTFTTTTNNVTPAKATPVLNNSYQVAPTLQREDVYSFESLESLPPYVNANWMNRLFEYLQSKWKSLIKRLGRYRRQTYIALFLAITQQLCGQTIVLNYAPQIFASMADSSMDTNVYDNNNNNDNDNDNDNDDNNNDNNEMMNDLPPSWSTVWIGVVKFFVTVLVIWRIEYWGRRKLLLLGMICISIGMVALIVAFGGATVIYDDDDNDNDNDNDDAYGNDKNTTFSPTHTSLALPGVLLVVCGYSMSFGPLTWLMTAELFPTEIRGRALGASTIVTYLIASLVTRTFLSASSALGPSKVFGIYCIITTMGIVFAYLAIPDTGDKTVQQIEEVLPSMWWWRYDSILLPSTSSTSSSSLSSSPPMDDMSSQPHQHPPSQQHVSYPPPRNNYSDTTKDATLTTPTTTIMMMTNNNIELSCSPSSDNNDDVREIT